MTRATAISTVYFGKIPSRGDFVRSANQAALTQTLDRWLTRGIELMAIDPRWKEMYDQVPPVHFAFLGAHSRAALVGHLIASADSSGRRFPFVAAGSFEVNGPLSFMGRSPMALTRLWSRFEGAARRAVGAPEDAAAVLGDFQQTRVEIEAAASAYDASYRDFVEMQTVGSLEAMLCRAGHSLRLRRLLLAMGLLLQPVPASGADHLDNGLRLPLPADPLYAPYVATLWLDLIARFLARGDFEVALFLPGPSVAGTGFVPSLQIGFSGDSPATLQAMLDPNVGRAVFVDPADSEWVEEQIETDYALKKLASYLEQPDLSLQQAVATFGEAFLGV